MAELLLSGCTPEPLMSYLKALGVFRLVAEQADPAATLSWPQGTAHLVSKLDSEGLNEFFLKRYRPTPILAPWNGGSGFYGGGEEPLVALEESTSERLGEYREAIAAVRKIVPGSKPKDDQKEALLARCRANLADSVVPWLDVCFVLGEQGPGYFPLLGTGGNDGRLDFTNNFFQRLGEVVPFDADNSTDSGALLGSAIFGDRASRLVSLERAAVGQFNPGGIGGPNGVQGCFEAGSRVNPWDYVLMIEGTLLFAGSVARRLGSSATARAVFPFSVSSVAVGYGSAVNSEETLDGSRAELWLPLWESEATLPEVRQTFAEGRAQFRRRQARNAVEFALAASLLGVNRGVTAFARYGFLKRNGLAFLAAPLGRVVVTLRPTARLLEDPALTSWLDRLRFACRDKDKTPARYQAALRGIDDAMFSFVNRSEAGNDQRYLIEVLRAIGRTERTLAVGNRFAQEKFIRPLSGLSTQWLTQADDDSPEFRLAASLAGIIGTRDRCVGPMRAFMEEVEVTKFVNWSPGSTSAVWSNRSLEANLAAVFRRRLMEAFRNGLLGVPLTSIQCARIDDVTHFLEGATNDERLEDLLWGLIGVVPPSAHPEPEPRPNGHMAPRFEYGVLRLLAEHRPLSFRYREAAADATVTPDPDVFHLLASGQRDAVNQSLTRAARRLRSDGLSVIGYRNRAQAGRPIEVVTGIRPVRLLAAMLFPLSDHNYMKIANSVLYPPESET